MGRLRYEAIQIQLYSEQVEAYLCSIVPKDFVAIVLLWVVRGCHLYPSNSMMYLNAVWLHWYVLWSM